MSACSAALDEISLESLRRQAAEGEARAQKVLRTLSNPTVFLRGVALWRMLCMGTAGAAAWSWPWPSFRDRSLFRLMK